MSFKFVKDLKDKLVDIVNRTIGPNSNREAVAEYKKYVKELQNAKLSGNQLLQSRNRLKPIIRREDVGRMFMFFYDPKMALELPYFDRFPLVIPIEFYKDGFLGVNLHYLPPLHRAKLLDAMLNIMGKQYINERKRLFMSYEILRGYSRTRMFQPCLKRYLYTHVRSRFYQVEPENWQIAVLLPTERFEKASKQRVFTESLQSIRK